MAKPITREHRIYLALWRKAYKSEEPVSFKCSNFAMAVAIRQGMYRAIKPFRYGELEDTELKDAAEKFVVFLVKNRDENGEHLKDKTHFIELRPRVTLLEANSIFDELDLEEDELYVGEERIISEKLKGLIEKGPAKPTSKTPFYSRED